MSATDFGTFAPSNDTITNFYDRSYYRSFGGFWAEERINAVTHDTIVYEDESVEIQVNGTDIEEILDGQFP